MFLGIDIGTTSVCAVGIDGGNTVFTETLPNDSAVYGRSYEKLQSADGIYGICKRLFDKAASVACVESVGISNQMHGIVYLDKSGKAVSPLITWQDGRGNLQRKTDSYAKELSEMTGTKLATGYGAVTLFYDTENDQIPPQTHKICTIGDYVAMRLCNKTAPIMHESNAHSIGLFDVKNHCWNERAIKAAGMDSSLFPEVSRKVCFFGRQMRGAAVYIAAGDNQASVYGATRDDAAVVVNIGTGSQVSVILAEYSEAPAPCETRPYFDGKFLITGGALCGGYAYQLLKKFYNGTGIGEVDYLQMNTLAEKAIGKSLPLFDVKFRGTRENPAETASITGLTAENFNAPALTLALLKGESRELKELYGIMLKAITPRKVLVGSGNAVRFNPVLQKIISEDFNLPLTVSACSEEAAFGAALLAAGGK